MFATKGLNNSRSRSRGSAVPDLFVNNFPGLLTIVKDPKKLKKGETADELNWLTGPLNDHIELRMGQALLGLTRNVGAGKITGLTVGVRQDGTQIPFFSYARKIKYYDPVANDTVEVGSNLLPAAASGEDIAFDIYNNIAGAWVYFSSPNSSIYKIPVANPGSAVDQISASFKGYIRIKQNRMFEWNNKVTASGAQDKTGLNLSYIDKTLLSQYTLVTNENIGTGDGATKTFTGTLAARTGKRTVFNILITDTNEQFLDDKNGKLVGALGGTGTINYATGAFSLTFNTAPAGAQAITAQYNWEDATTQGVADFSFSGGGRTAGQGDYFRQDDGGGSLMSVFSYGGDEYCIHQLKTWVTTITGTDTNATNLIYRNKVGIPYFRAGDETGNGILYLDYADKNNPALRILTLSLVATNVVPVSLSNHVDLSQYAFDFPVVKEWGDYQIVCCQKLTNGVKDTYNNVMFVRNKRTDKKGNDSGVWDKLDFSASCLGNYSGVLLAGDPISNNVMQLFSGYDDDGQLIPNFWNSGLSNLNVEGRKKFYKFIIDGYINPSQIIQINFSFDNGAFTSPVTGLTIKGTDPIVDLGSGIYVGGQTTGSQIIGSTAPAANAYHFRKEISVASDIFEFVQVQFQALGIGALQVNEYGFSDIRYKGRRVASQYIS